MNFAQSLIAVLAGNIIYFLVMPYLPAAARHVRKYDFGVVVDFLICLAIFAAIRVFANRQKRSDERR